jgi:putative aminopeptidase FrvX
MDEIALIVRAVEPDGRLRVGPLGGIHPWKFGEGPVDILATSEPLQGVLGFGGVHTEDRSSVAVQAREKPVTWDMARVFTGCTAEDLRIRGVRPGTRVVVGRSRRRLTRMGEYISGHFLDDRADLVAWLLALRELRTSGLNILFAATAAEEVGGEGAQFLLHWLRPSICIALELAANVPDAPVTITANPSVWTQDSYAATSAHDLDTIARLGEELGLDLQYQAYSRGGSDASCAASKGLCARPITLGIPIENSHGYEIMHRDAMESLAHLTVSLIRKLAIA